jgi:predicted transcriptional regulator
MSSSDSFPDRAIDDIAYLSRSKNRIRILAALATEAFTRRKLGEETNTARTTLDRIINELEERDWVRRSADGDYTVTPTGERIAAESTRFVGAIEAIHGLGEAVSWLPHEELTVGLQHFRDATVLRPQPNATAAPSTYVTQLLQEATEFACLVNIPPSLGFEDAMINGVTSGRLTTKHVITDGELDVLRQNPERTRRWQSYIDAGAELYCYAGSIPCNLLIIDETVIVLDRQPKALEGIESTNTAIQSWAHEMIDRYKEDSKRLDTSAFSQDSPAKTEDSEH